ncbi:hypothetical protein PYCCODRAFT_1392235 [Trametes coccinea BRFM310]|uniref:ABC transporter ATPase n=1 Tax=Trametes coccinea (strain BRFM310) TaxID=1353009 RepID=A0A1Y2IKG5_TRAC3|nr:hypothetical protein PYCCODRAFT_1392235 [Trametes coccinea BRFM310]
MSGRGAYYKQLYGGRGRGRARGGPPAGDNSDGSTGYSAHSFRGTKRSISRSDEPGGAQGSSDDLLRKVRSLGGKSYPAYRDLQGHWEYPTFQLYVDHVQSDPYAPPSKLRVRVPRAVAGIPPGLFSNKIRTVALCDYLTREVCALLDQKFAGRSRGQQSGGGGWAGEKGGQVTVDRPGQQVLERSSVVLTRKDDDSDDVEAGVELRFCVSLPAQGRTILGEQAVQVFADVVPALARSLLYSSHDATRMAQFVDCVEDQEDLRRQIADAGLVAFVPNGAVLPRASGAADTPMKAARVVPFQSPPNLERTFVLPHRGPISGMAIPRGITMIAGGGFHGKSTLLDALARGCYNHVPGDGREFLVTSSGCVSIQGEDGRAVTNVDISPFIGDLPGGVPTASFSTQDASGSTSMAAGVIEAMQALEMGADALLFDEDTCATNFLIRDRRMQRLVSADPITPLVYKVRAMLKDHGCSSVLVIGGCGDYCDVADLVLEMRDYRCFDITGAAKQVAQEIPSAVPDHEASRFGSIRPRYVQVGSLPSGDKKVAARKRTAIEIGGETLDLSALVQLVHDSQTRAIAAALKHFHHSSPSVASLKELQEDLETSLDTEGLDAIVQQDRIDGFLARPRSFELAMAINRLRTVSIGYNGGHVLR